MQARRLGWAGVELQAQGRRFLIDAMDNVAPLKDLLGDPHWPMFAVPRWDGTTETHALVTHRHPDHFDPAALHRALGPAGVVYCPADIADEVEAAGLTARGLSTWDCVKPPEYKGIAITAVPAVDWRGDAQVSWVVEDGTSCVLHGGDTIWHGSWWAIADRFPNIDIAFLPVNGVIARMKGMKPSNLPATMTPDQAAVAARLLGARRLCPIHYGQFHAADTYREHADLNAALAAATAREGVCLIKASDGQTVLAEDRR